MRRLVRNTLRVRCGRLAVLILSAVLLLLLAAPAPTRAATIKVTTTSDVLANDGLCSLREAVIAANTNTPSGAATGECVAGESGVTDIISVPAGLYTLTIPNANPFPSEDAAQTGDLDVTAGSTVVIQGAGAGDNPVVHTIIQACTAPQTGTDACGTGTLAGATGVEDRVFHVVGGGNLTLEDLTVRHGRTIKGSPGGAGAFLESGSLIVTRSLVTANRAPTGAGGISSLVGPVTVTASTISRNAGGDGGGIGSGSTLTITDSTISGNTGGVGGGIVARSRLTLLGSTVSGNISSGDGGGITAVAVTIANTTISGNSALAGGGIAIPIGTGHTLVNVTIAGNTATNNVGGGLRLGAEPVDDAALRAEPTNNVGGGPRLGDGEFSSLSVTLTLTNTLIAGNMGPDCTLTDGTLTGDHTLIEDGNCGGIVNGVNGNITGVPALLDAALADNGGPTQTHALLTGSPALTAGDAAACANPVTVNNLDQRGLARPQGAACDVGAYEALRLSIAGLAQNEGNAGSTPFQFPVTLSTAVPLGFPSVTVQYATSAGGPTPATPGVDFTAVAGTVLTFTPGTASQNATVLVTGEVAVEANETFLVTLSNPVGAVLLTAQATGTILNDDIPHFVVAAPATAFLGTSVNFTVTARNAADTIVTGYAGTVLFTSSDPLATLPAPASLTNGTGTFPATFGTLGNQTLTATDSLNPAITGISSLIAVVRVTSVSAPSPTGTGPITATLAGGGPTCTISNSQFLPPPPGTPPVPPTTPGPGITFPHGLFAFTATRCAPGASLTLTLTYPQPLTNLVYWKFGPTAVDPTPHWYVFPATIVRNTVTFSITDGGLGDADLAANGTIVDPGGVGSIPPIPTLSPGMLVALALLLLAAGAHYLSRFRLRG